MGRAATCKFHNRLQCEKLFLWLGVPCRIARVVGNRFHSYMSLVERSDREFSPPGPHPSFFRSFFGFKEAGMRLRQCSVACGLIMFVVLVVVAGCGSGRVVL